MADVAAGPEGAARWSRDLSDEDQPPVFVPGVSTERTFRARHLLRGRKTEVKMEAPATAAAATSVPTCAPPRTGEVAGQQMPDKGEIKSASLKDLCPEDKRRIANLIKELARVSEEKEVTEVRLKTEQESFEKKIRQLEEQNDLIIREREALQQQYRECQELLSLYQKYLSDQQEKLTHSLSELEVAKEREHQMSNHRSLGHPRSHLELDGSYLGIARPQTLYKNNRTACRSPSPKPMGKIYRNCHVGATIHDSRQEETKKFLLENGLHSKCNNMVSPPRARTHSPCRRTAAVDQRRNLCPRQTCFYHKRLGSPDRDSLPKGSHVYKRHSGPCCETFPDYCHSPRTSGLNGSMDSGLKDADGGKKLSEERRKQLLLQKMELEIEKERLQNLLSKQEAKLLLQQQRLQQSRLDYDRCKGRTSNSEELLVDEALMRAGGLASVMNGCTGGLSSPKHSFGGCLSKTPPASAKGCRAPGSSGGNSSGKKSVGFIADVEDAEHWGGAWKEVPRTRREMSPGSRKDVATSPGLTGCRKELVTTATSPIQHDISRYKASLLDLVEAMSPKHQHKSCESHSHDKTSQKIPSWRWGPSSARNGGADLEESRILEDIFFI